jgi:hypothetical protein
VTTPNAAPQRIKLVARTALGLIWLYLGSVSKWFWQVPEELAIVERSGLFVVSPAWTIAAIGAAEVACGIWLLSGWRERAAVLATTGFLVGLCVPVVAVDPGVLLGPFGGLVKNLALLACAWVVWVLAARDR